MTKSILVAALAIVSLSLMADSASAARRRCCQQSACCATQCCATPCSAPAIDTNAPPPPQTTATNAYQSDSYEPSSAAVPMMVAPAQQPRRSTSFYDQFRGDRKVRGIF